MLFFGFPALTATDTTMTTSFIGPDTAPFYESATARNSARELLWGDRIEILDPAPVSGRLKVRARGQIGYARPADLGGSPLLELYFIDVGQGDGVLIVTPDGRHLLIDGGYKRAAQPTGKNAADFVDWKFVRELGRQDIVLDAMIASHNDADHYGGLWDLLNPAPESRKELKARSVTVKEFYTAGVSWLRSTSKTRFLGRTRKVGKLSHLMDLLDSRARAEDWLLDGAPLRLQGEWAEFIRCLLLQQCPIHRLSHRTPWLPGFAPGDVPAGSPGPRIRVLGPIEYQIDGAPALRSLGTDSKNTNGNSIVLRLDYGSTRILLTGDLNAVSQDALLAAFPDAPGEFAADVTKACHHGADDCSLNFLKAVGAGATIISSGDSEGHGHPRPAIVAASGITGHLEIAKDRLVTPLVYSTEIARSYRLGRITSILDAQRNPVPASDDYRGRYQETNPGSLKPRTADQQLVDSHLVSGVVYGLVNVRTDGRRILCATLNEGDGSWDTRAFTSRFAPPPPVQPSPVPRTQPPTPGKRARRT